MTTEMYRNNKVASALRLALKNYPRTREVLFKEARAITALMGYREPTDSDLSWSLEWIQTKGEAVHVRHGYWQEGNEDTLPDYNREWQEKHECV
jgi:hypothetical protein